MEDRVWSFDDLFRRFLRSDILKRTSPAFIPLHRIFFLAAYSFFCEDRPFIFFQAWSLLRILQNIGQYEYFLFSALGEEKLGVYKDLQRIRVAPTRLELLIF